MSKMANIYDKIREEKTSQYAETISRVCGFLLARLYSDRTHFVYELLQNTEDACERARTEGSTDRFTARFRLFHDRLELRHNGIPFNENDVKGICGLLEGTKESGIFQIGKFGIGFKSVYAYTKTPVIYSGDKSFCIRNYIEPHYVTPRPDVKDGETLIVIPFDHDTTDKETAFREISDRLGNLGVRTLLFLRNVEEVSFQIDGLIGKYARNSKVLDGSTKRVELIDVRKKERETWLVLMRELGKDRTNNVRVEVAFLLDRDTKAGRESVTKVVNPPLVAFFPTGKETHLKFLIQGPYNTTPERDNIQENDQWNQKLIEETAILVADSISYMKQIGLLDLGFLDVLPIESEYFSGERNMFKPIFAKVREQLLSESELLPAGGLRYTNAKKALIARGKELRELLSSEQLSSLFNRRGAEWLDEDISLEKFTDLRSYMVEELQIREIEPDAFAREFTEEFIQQQSDIWIKKLYDFLMGQKALWEKKPLRWGRDLPLRSKPIIRLEDDSHTLPFDADGKPLAYLPSKYSKYFRTVKGTIARDPRAKEFLESLGLTEPDSIAAILDVFLPKYENEHAVSLEENIQHIDWICKTLKSSANDDRKELLIKKLRETAFLLAKNSTGERKYRKPFEIYLGEVYTGDSDSETYFAGNPSAWFLAEEYKNTVDDWSQLQLIGCSANVKVTFRKPNPNTGNVEIINYWGLHERGLDGFDPECQIDGLEFALENPDLKRAVIIWNILKTHYKRIRGVIESATHQDYSGSKKETKLSTMGELLTKHAWLPDAKVEFHAPLDISRAGLNEALDRDSLEAKHVAEKLGLQADAEMELLQQLPQDRRRAYEILKSAPEKTFKRIMELLEEDAEKASDLGISETIEKIKDALETPQVPPSDDRSGSWRGVTPEEEEQSTKEFGKELVERLRGIRIVTATDITKSTKAIDKTADARQFLLEQYGGHCQVCNTRLDLGRNKTPYFDHCRLVKLKDKPELSTMEFNALCLCPNCHALMDHGGRELKGVWETAEKVKRKEIAPEEVTERKGDFYVARVTIAGKASEIFYSPLHMAKLVAILQEPAA